MSNNSRNSIRTFTADSTTAELDEIAGSYPLTDAPSLSVIFRVVIRQAVQEENVSLFRTDVPSFRAISSLLMFYGFSSSKLLFG